MERTLFVFEGEVREKLYFQSLERAFFDGQQSRILVSFQNDIYELYKQLNEEDDKSGMIIVDNQRGHPLDRELADHRPAREARVF